RVVIDGLPGTGRGRERPAPVLYEPAPTPASRRAVDRPDRFAARRRRVAAIKSRTRRPARRQYTSDTRQGGPMNRLNSRHLPVAVDRALGAVRTTDLDTRTDTDLLERFARYGEHPAFEVLLRRHGPVVYGVCRRMLANPADADDAFQATFLVLVRRARGGRGERPGAGASGGAGRGSAQASGRAAPAPGP